MDKEITLIVKKKLGMAGYHQSLVHILATCPYVIFYNWTEDKQVVRKNGTYKGKSFVMILDKQTNGFKIESRYLSKKEMDIVKNDISEGKFTSDTEITN